MRMIGGWFGKSRAVRLALLLFWVAPNEALAQPPEYGPYRRPGTGVDPWGSEPGSRARAPASGEYVHDGYYLRLAGGVGAGSDRVDGTGRSNDGPAGRLRGSSNGFAGATQVALGF